jgi:hypothetical protein
MPTRHDPDCRPRQPFPIWCGLTLANWLRLLAQRPTLQWSRAGRIAGVTAAACANSVLALAERIVYARGTSPIGESPTPLFILGHWRSGTTLLHSWLLQDPQFTAPTVYQTWFPEHFLLTERWLSRLTAPLLPATRPMDNMPFMWDGPGEEEMALLLTTLLSPYLVAAFADQPENVKRLDNLQRGLSVGERQRWQRQFLRFLGKVALRRPGTLVLKSPPHTGRIPLLLELFPEARFLYIVRNPYEVFASTRHLHTVLCRENGFSRAAPADLHERILSTYSDLYQAYHLQRALVPEPRRMELRYEDLIADPVGMLRTVYGHFGFEGADRIAERLQPHLDRHRNYSRNVYELDDDLRREIAERWGPAFRRYGYTV